jgi:hypothetical protein
MVVGYLWGWEKVSRPITLALSLRGTQNGNNWKNLKEILNFLKGAGTL